METDIDYDMSLGEEAVDFTLQGVDGKKYELDDFDEDILVIFFTCNHCPYAQAYEDRIMKVVDDFEDVDFVAINSNDSENYPEDSFEKMKEKAEEEGFNFPYLRDKKQTVATDYGAECTPHFFVFDGERKLRYQGAFDDNWQNPRQVDNEYVQTAIEDLQEGEEVETPLTSAMGCSIKWK